MKKKTQITSNELIIISVLANGERFGKEILDILSSQERRKIHKKPISDGSLYNTLNSLVKKELIECHYKEKLSRRGNRRKYFSLTYVGRNRLNYYQVLLNQLWGNKNIDKGNVSNIGERMTNSEKGGLGLGVEDFDSC